MATQKTSLITADDLAELDDEWRCDLIEGELFRMSPTSGNHGRRQSDLQGHIWLHVRQHKLGAVYGAETGFLLARDPDTVPGPDIAFVRAERVPLSSPGYVPLAPDLAVEIRSGSEHNTLVERKVAAYLSAGVRLVWSVDAERQAVAIHRPNQPPRILSMADELDGEDVLPGFRLPLAELFR